MSNNIGLITEQGDLGFGFDPLNPKDEKTYKESSMLTNNDASNSSKEKEDK